jgi:trimeric autotransporter adhesin
MKKILLLMLGQLALDPVLAQTHYGTSAGTQGAAYSYFGAFAGNAALNTSYENSFFGASSGRVTTTGYGNTAVGANSLRFNTTGHWNTAIGNAALHQNTNGFRNTAVGRMSLYGNTGGDYNVAIGYYSLLANTDGLNNTATGSKSLYDNSTGNDNTATGFEALYSNTTASNNTAIGSNALRSNLTGTGNAATGGWALYANTTGSNNTATGYEALNDNIDGINNTAIGSKAMNSIDAGSNNTAVGYFALPTRTGSYNSAFGRYAMGTVLVTAQCYGSYNSAFGADSGPTAVATCEVNNTTALGANTKITSSNQIRLGDPNVTSIGGQVSWTTLSDGRFKRDIKKDVAGLEFINALNPVSYTLDKIAINKFLGIPDSVQAANTAARTTPHRQIGFVAQEVEAIVKKSGYVFSGIEAPQNDADPYTIRYAEFVVPLVKAVQELSTQVADLQKQLKKYTNEPTMVQQGAMSTGAFLYQNNPNPFSNTTEIRMELPETTGQANIIVYNLEGKQLKNIEVSERGKTVVTISGNALGAGMYLYALIVDGEVIDTKRLILTQ